MSDKDEITDLGEAIAAIIQSPPGTWVDNDGEKWKWEDASLYWFDDRGYCCESSINVLNSSLPIKRVRYGWVPCEREEAFQLPDGCRVYMGKLWDPVNSTPLLSRLAMVEPWCTWVKWGQL